MKANYKSSNWYTQLHHSHKQLLEELREAQRSQGDMSELNPHTDQVATATKQKSSNIFKKIGGWFSKDDKAPKENKEEKKQVPEEQKRKDKQLTRRESNYDESQLEFIEKMTA
jgi:hypothetical protein